MLVTDKATFGRDRIMNFYNQYHWAGVVDDCLMGTFWHVGLEATATKLSY
jgi:hypothetical protein